MKAGCILSAPREKVNLFERASPRRKVVLLDSLSFPSCDLGSLGGEPILNRLHLVLKVNGFVSAIIDG
jgi:hypothetical protein